MHPCHVIWSIETKDFLHANTELGKSVAAEKIEIDEDYEYVLIEGVKYQVYRSTKSGSGYKLVKTTDKTYFTTTSVKKGTKYYFKVRAVKEIGGEKYYGHYSNKVNGKRG